MREALTNILANLFEWLFTRSSLFWLSVVVVGTVGLWAMVKIVEGRGKTVEVARAEVKKGDEHVQAVALALLASIRNDLDFLIAVFVVAACLVLWRIW